MSRYRRSWDWEQFLIVSFFGLALVLIVAFAVVVMAALIDGWYDNRAARKQIACAVQRMDHRRVPFTTDVTCVPKALDTRNDTVTVRVPEGA